MSYCPKCGNKVDESMAFCPRCGASLRATAAPPPAPTPPYQRRNEKGEKNEKNEKNESREKQEKGERGFVGYLIGGLILIAIGLFSVLQLSNALPDSGQNWAILLLIPPNPVLVTYKKSSMGKPKWARLSCNVCK